MPDKTRGFTFVPSRSRPRRSPTGTVSTVPKGWCYICKADHLYAVPCKGLEGRKWYR